MILTTTFVFRVNIIIKNMYYNCYLIGNEILLHQFPNKCNIYKNYNDYKVHLYKDILY